MNQNEIRFVAFALVCLSDESGVPLRELMESIGQENLEEIMTGAFLGEFMSPDEMAYEINRFCGLELPLELPHRGIGELKGTGEALSKLLNNGEDLYSVLTSELASDISMALSSDGKAALPAPPSPEIADEFYTTLLQMGRKVGINWATASDEEKAALAEMARDPLLHVQIYYYPWRGDVLQFRVKEIFHLSAEVNTIAEGKERIEAALVEYAEECSANSETYRQHFRRRYHLPYMIWVQQSGELEKMLVYENEDEVRAALASPEKDIDYWQQLAFELEDEVAATYMSLAKDAGINLVTASAEEKEELMEHVMYHMEREGEKSDG